METENAQTTIDNWENLSIGTKERQKLEAKDCTVQAVENKYVGGGKKYPKLVIHLKHPDREAPLNVSDAKVETKGQLEIKALFINLDEDGKLQKGSAIAALLNHYNVPSINGLVGKTVKTTVDDKGYICIKAY
jgi:hypothetical protein